MVDEEKTASDAPVWYSAEEAWAWACGYNRAVRDAAEAVADEASDITGWGDV